MQLNDVIRRLRTHRAELEQLGVRSLAVFGSVAREEAGEGSDVDLLVEFSRPIGFFGFFDVKDRLEQILETRVDLVTRDAVKPALRERILREAIDAA